MAESKKAGGFSGIFRARPAAGKSRGDIAALSAAIFAVALAVLGASSARADRIIETPAAVNLAPSQASAEDDYGLDRRPDNEFWVGDDLHYVELEGAQLQQSDRQATVVSAQVAILPETFTTPSIAAGIRDIFDTSRQFGALGYMGRSAYVVVGKTLFNTAQAPYPLRNAALTLGLGTGVTNGLFGSASADLGFGLRQTIEYDGRGINYRISRALGSVGRVEYERLHGANYIGLELWTPVRI